MRGGDEQKDGTIQPKKERIEPPTLRHKRNKHHKVYIANSWRAFKKNNNTIKTMAEHINPEMNKEAFNCAICELCETNLAYGYEKRYAEINDGQRKGIMDDCFFSVLIVTRIQFGD